MCDQNKWGPRFNSLSALPPFSEKGRKKLLFLRCIYVCMFACMKVCAAQAHMVSTDIRRRLDLLKTVSWTAVSHYVGGAETRAPACFWWLRHLQPQQATSEFSYTVRYFIYLLLIYLIYLGAGSWNHGSHYAKRIVWITFSFWVSLQKEDRTPLLFKQHEVHRENTASAHPAPHLTPSKLLVLFMWAHLFLHI